MGGAKAHYDGIVAFSQTDFTDDLKKITVPVLVMHGDDDQIVPYADSGPLSAKLLKNGTLKTYKGFPHGMPTTQADTINADLLAFLRSAVAAKAQRSGTESREETTSPPVRPRHLAISIGFRESSGSNECHAQDQKTERPVLTSRAALFCSGWRSGCRLAS